MGDFLLCGNCVNWSQPWRLGRTTVVCEESSDAYGVPYSTTHKACEYFVPVQSNIPEEVQRVRLFVQMLSSEQRSYFKWALGQSELLLGMLDAKSEPLSLGDQVTFRMGIHGYTGTLEGIDPVSKKTNVIINSPAFAQSTISLLSTSVTKVSKPRAKEILREPLSDRAHQSIEWNVECLIYEIATLRSKKRQLTAEEHDMVLTYERDLSNLDAMLQYDAIVKTLLK